MAGSQLAFGASCSAPPDADADSASVAGRNAKLAVYFRVWDAPRIVVSRNWFMRVADCLDVDDAVLLKWFCRKFIDAGDPY